MHARLHHICTLDPTQFLPDWGVYHTVHSEGFSYINKYIFRIRVNVLSIWRCCCGRRTIWWWGRIDLLWIFFNGRRFVWGVWCSITTLAFIRHYTSTSILPSADLSSTHRFSNSDTGGAKAALTATRYNVTGLQTTQHVELYAKHYPAGDSGPPWKQSLRRLWNT